TSIIMGANIGTTLTAWVLSLGGFDVTTFFLCLAAVGVFITMFAKTDKPKSVGFALAALGLIFVGLEFMSGAFDQQKYPEIFESIKTLFSKINNPLLLLAIGIAVTALIQSSTAVTAIVLEMSLAGLAVRGGGNAVYYIIIGSNIGTCVTALISSLGASPNAKRAAVIHFLFNFFGAIIFAVVLLCWEGFANTVLVSLFPSNPAMQIAMFHTLFNTVCTLVFLPFVNIFVKLANVMVREKKIPEAEQQPAGLVADLDERLLRSPSVALGHLYQETGKMFSYAMDTLSGAVEAFLRKDVSEKEKVAQHNEELLSADQKTVEYLVKISASSLLLEEEKTISSLHYVLNDIVRIGELADNVTKYTNHYVNDNLVFSSEFLDATKNMYEKIKTLYVLSLATYLYNDCAAARGGRA
ncbi:MAG: Na/Pi symporter, partial [Clostridia bacterium]|nr:Na/Pi symporter [Clostridia bacterium]